MTDAEARPGQPSVRIAGELRRRIAAGELAPGDRLPSTRQITRDWGVAMATATKALTTLRQEGLVRAVPGVGTVVAPAPAPGLGPVPAPGPGRTAPPAARVPAPAPAPHRGRTAQGPLTRERIVATALRLADAQGMGELSMRRVATELGVATMALYRYVPSKDDLVVLMMDEVFATLDPPSAGSEVGWRMRLDQLCRVQWAGYRRHPWLAAQMSFSRPQLIPRGMRHTEYAMAVAREVGLDLTQALHVAVTLALHVRGVAVAFEQELQAQQETGLTADEWMKTQEESFLPQIQASGDFPMITETARIPGDALNLDSLFEFGLARILDGIEVMVAANGRP